MRRLFFILLFAAFCTSPYAHAETSNAEVSKKLDQILESQKEIVRQLEEVKKELYVVKIRTTR